MTSIPTIGRIVHYKLTDADIDQINRRRFHATEHLGDHQATADGSQIHVGNHVEPGQVFPAMIVRTWGATSESAVQLQVFLDGNDTYWATSRQAGAQPGQWAWPNTAKAAPVDAPPVEAMEPPYADGHGLFQ